MHMLHPPPYSMLSSDCESGREDGEKVIYKHGVPHRSELCATFMRTLDKRGSNRATKLGTDPIKGEQHTRHVRNHSQTIMHTSHMQHVRMYSALGSSWFAACGMIAKLMPLSMHMWCPVAAAAAKHRHVNVVQLWTTYGVPVRMLIGLDHIIDTNPSAPAAAAAPAAHDNQAAPSSSASAADRAADVSAAAPSAAVAMSALVAASARTVHATASRASSSATAHVHAAPAALAAAPVPVLHAARSRRAAGAGASAVTGFGAIGPSHVHVAPIPLARGLPKRATGPRVTAAAAAGDMPEEAELNTHL
jgi:hypothetical protein